MASNSASTDNCRVLSIQSHVVYGYVGNRCAVFPLQLHGFEVDSINSVQFSNHTGYDHFQGQVLKSEQLSELYEGLKKNGINRYSHLLTGYVADKSFLLQVLEIIKDLKSNGDLYYVCDPVMGDNGEYYVNENLMSVYRDDVIGQADVVAPNQFELEVLTDRKIAKEDDLLAAVAHLHHKHGIPNVVITSTNLAPTQELMFVYASSSKGSSMTTYRYEVKRIPCMFFGTGDLFCSLLLAWLHKCSYNLQDAVSKVLGSIQSCLRRTMDAYAENHSDMCEAAKLELKLIQCGGDFINPTLSVPGVQIHPHV